ncbi:MAG: hypothetical protein ACRDYX_23755, partial [Egibacteraceae bacterium]
RAATHARTLGEDSPVTADHPAIAVRALVAYALDLCDQASGCDPAGELELVGMLLGDALAVLDDDAETWSDAADRDVKPTHDGPA